MTDSPASILSHVSIGTNRFSEALAFYDRVLATVGCRRILEHDDAVAYGRQFPEFWVQAPFDGGSAAPGNGIHFGFIAEDKQAVHDFFDTAVACGGDGEGEPGPRPRYGEPYYGCFVRDLDGHKIEAAFWDLELAARLAGTA